MNVALHKMFFLLLLSTAVILAVLAIPKALGIMMPFLVAMLIAKILSPFVHLLSLPHKRLRGFMTFVLIIALIALIVFGIYLLGNFIFDSAQKLADAIPDITQNVLDYIAGLQASLDNNPWIASYQPNIEIMSTINTGINTLLTKISQEFQTIAVTLLGIVRSFPNLLLFIIITFVSTFFLIKDEETLRSKRQAFFAKHQGIFKSKYLQTMKHEIITVFGGYIKAQLILMTITFVLSTIGLYILGISYAPLVALGIALVDALPMLGTAIIYVPWAIISLLAGNYFFGIGMLILYLTCTLTRQFLEPKIVSTQIGLYPLITLLSMYTGFKLLGTFGLLLGPILFIIGKSAVKVINQMIADVNDDKPLDKNEVLGQK